MAKKPEILAQQVLSAEQVAANVFKVEQLHLRFANGQERHYRRIQSSSAGAVLIVPLLDAETVLMIREYAAGVHRYELQLPKGQIERDESPLQAANRELKEEIGYGAQHLHQLHTLTIAPGFFSHETHIILARDLYEERLPGDEPEEIEVVPWRLDRLHELTGRSDCTEARSIAALYMVREYLQGGKP